MAELSDYLPQGFAGNSRVWLYQSNRKFSPTEEAEINEMIKHFTSQWQSHGTPVKGFGSILFSQFILLMADESASGVSGCSTDSSVRLIKELEKKFGTSLFSWQDLAFWIERKVQIIPLSDLQSKVDEGSILPETLYFNNTVTDLQLLKKDWMIPVRESWLSKRISFSKSLS